MKYRDLVQFEPIETIVQLREASKQDYAFNLLDTYVISDRMADVLINVVFEQLQYDRQADQKGLLVVGNYGTGKSHLMSVISTIAETDGSARRLHNSNVAEKAQTIEGKFHVIREEIGATTMPLRDIVCGSIQENLAKMGVDYSFPSIDQVRSNKDAFAEMMGVFHEKYPDKGLLVVIDELLDYLRHRKEQEIILDLGFLRELGEICRTTRFRFIAGVQEMLFENPRFQFVADQLRRVKERFEQVQIVREDVAYVVSERLLKKNDRQKALIREHLQKFSPLYEGLGSKLDEFVTLFPVHPAYLSTFERVSVAEKREILKTISGEIRKLHDNDVPSDEPGVISFDSYWPYIEADSSLRSDPNIREVLGKSRVLQEKIETGFTRPHLKGMAIRIVRALSVHRLTTGDINISLGLTSSELRDQLFLHAEIPEEDSEFLRTTIETTLREILKTVSYQYISVNEANGQYYLDLAKDEPVDDFIEDKAQALSKGQLDRHYFTVLSDVMEKSLNNTYVGNYKIWKHELNWISRKTSRLGYLFFGAPNERSTAQPPRDFYVYMLQPYDPPKFKDEQQSDEIFFRLKHRDEVFDRLLSLYAAARELEGVAPSGTQELYRNKADGYLKQVNKWLRDNLLNAFEITYKGKNYKLTAATSQIPANASSSEIVDAIASTYLSEWFDEKYPDYPYFSRLRSPLTEANVRDYVQQTLRAISGTKTQSALAILNGLVLYKDEASAILDSGYAKWVLRILDAKGHGQVVNRSELIEKIFTSQGTEDVEQIIEFKLEPELFVVVLGALVYNGSIVLTINGTQYDAMKYEELAKLPLKDIVNFSHIKKPSGFPMDALNELVALLELPPATLHLNMLELGLRSIQTKVQELVQETIAAIEIVKGGIQCWEGPLLTSEEQRVYREQLDDFKQFLEVVTVYNTVAKLQNFKFSVEQVQGQKPNVMLLAKVAKMENDVNKLSGSVRYLLTAKGYLPLNDEWSDTLDDSLGNLLDLIKEGKSQSQELQTLKRLKSQFIDSYLKLHEKSRLNAHEDTKKASLLNDPKVGALKQLAEINLLPREHLDDKLRSLSELQACWSLTRETLEQTPYCAHCRFEPKPGSSMPSWTMDEFEEDIEDLLAHWTTTLINTFNDPELKQNIELLKQEQQTLVKSLLENGEFSLPIDVKLIQAIKELLEGIERVEITIDEVLQVMGNGNPLTVEELQARLNNLIRHRVRNKPTSRVRIMLKTREVN